MKKQKLRICLPFVEVIHKLDYELQWGSMKTRVLYHDLLDPDTALFLLENDRILHLKCQGQDTLLSIIEPDSSHLFLTLTDLLAKHLVG